MTDRYKVEAKQTVYAGIRFRSQLEATWAAFFDEFGWAWRYEPEDRAHPGWLPDFEVCGVLAEVKPIEHIDFSAVSDAWFEKALGSSYVLLLGASPSKDAIGALCNRTGGMNVCIHLGALKSYGGNSAESELGPGVIDPMPAWERARRAVLGVNRPPRGTRKRTSQTRGKTGRTRRAERR